MKLLCCVFFLGLLSLNSALPLIDSYSRGSLSSNFFSFFSKSPSQEADSAETLNQRIAELDTRLDDLLNAKCCGTNYLTGKATGWFAISDPASAR